MKSKYTYHFTDDVLVINDQGGMRSVTNDMEKILAVIHMNEAKYLHGTKIIYSDSIGNYDGVVAKNIGRNGRPMYQIEFIVWGARDEVTAIQRINEFHRQSQ